MKKLNNTQKALKRMIRDTESKITDEELFLSSAFQKYQTSLAKAATGRSRYGLQVLMEWDLSLIHIYFPRFLNPIMIMIMSNSNISLKSVLKFP